MIIYNTHKFCIDFNLNKRTNQSRGRKKFTNEETHEDETKICSSSGVAEGVKLYQRHQEQFYINNFKSPPNKP